MKKQKKKEHRRGVLGCCPNAVKLWERTERSIEASKNVTKLVGQSIPRF